jgi:hypothetical protein
MSEKYTAIPLVSSLVVALTGCAGDPIVGDWSATSILGDDVPVSNASTYTYGEYTIEYTFSMNSMMMSIDTELAGTISSDSSITYDEEIKDYSFEGTVAVTAGDESSYTIAVTVTSTAGEETPDDGFSLNCSLTDEELACSNDDLDGDIVFGK